MSATATNDRPARKQLADQLDRLDTILDALADALPAAVADACREGARQAVRDAVVEILASPELRTLITGLAAARVAPPVAPDTVSAPAAPPGDGFWSRAKAKLKAAKEAVAGRCKSAVTVVIMTASTLAVVVPVKKFVLIGAAVGVAVGLVSYASPHGLSAVLSGLGGACTAIAAQVGHSLRRSAAAIGFVTS